MEEVANLPINSLEFWSCGIKANKLHPVRRMASLVSFLLCNDYSELRPEPTEP